MSAPRVFVSSGAGFDTRLLTKELKELGYHPFVLSDAIEFGQSFTASIRSAVGAADAAIVVLDRGQLGLNIFEAGVISALGIPFVVVASDGVPVPLPLQDSPVIRALDVSLLAEALSAALSKVARSAAPREKALGATADRLTAVARGGTESAVAATIVEAIEQSGAIVVQSRSSDGFDMAIWSDDLASIGANPLMAEFIEQVTPSSVVRVAKRIDQLAPGSLALIVFGDMSPGVAAEIQRTRKFQQLMFVSSADLLHRMRSSSFARAVVAVRNESLHGLA